MRSNCEIKASPIVNATWWNANCVYSKFRRQGIDIICASFKHSSPKANIIFLTGLTESFIKYSEVIQSLFEKGFNVFTYDHQSQGLSGRWLPETQSLWVNSFEDYTDDFVYFVTAIAKEFSHLPMFLLAHSMGGFIACNAMSRLPTLINRAVLCAPMLRNKCGMKYFNYKNPLPQPVAYWLTLLSCQFGMGTMHALGYFKEKPTDKLPINVFTSDQAQLNKWQDLRMMYPDLITTCVTNDWTVHAIRAQRKLDAKYEFIKTNTLILSAEHDYLVYNRAMATFVKRAPHAKMFTAPGSYHEILFEQEHIREAALKVVGDFFSQKSDDVALVQPCFPLEPHNPTDPIYSVPELIVRGVGIVIATIGIIAGCAMILSGDKKRVAL